MAKKPNKVKELIEALSEMNAKNIPEDVVVEALRVSIESAYSKVAFVDEVEARAEVDIEKGDIKIFWIRNVVDHLEHDIDWTLDITLEDAKKIKKDVQIGDKFETPVALESLNRETVQRIKQNFIQQIKEASKKLVYDKFREKQGDILTGTVEKVEEGKYILIDLGKAKGYMPFKETIPGESYRIGDQIKVYVKEVSMDSKKESILLSRSDARFLFKLFSHEITEIENGDVYIVNIARIAGVRSKIVVSSKVKGLDAAGTCIGRSGTRIAKIVEQLNNGQEKIDVIEYYDDPLMTIKAALSPAVVEGIGVREEKMSKQVFNPETKRKDEVEYVGKVADVVVSNESLTKAIGSKGQNSFLARKLSKFDRLNIIPVDDAIGQVEYKRMAEIEANYFASINQAIPSSITNQNVSEFYKNDDEDNNVVVEEVSIKETKKETKKEVKEVVSKPVDVSIGSHISVVEEEKEEVEVKEKEPLGPSKKSIKKEEEARKAAIEEENKKNGMAIYTDEELKALEEEDVEDNEDEEIDYEDYDDYYDQY